MTRPAEVKIREGSTPGTAYGAFVVGAKLDPVKFQITPAIVAEYMASVEADPNLYVIDGRRVAPPNLLFVYMTSVIYRKYPPIQGIVMAEVDVRWHAPIWADETTDVVGEGKVTDKYEKRGRRYIRWQAEFRRADGTKLATLDNHFHVPE